MRPILNRIIREIVRMQFKKKQLEPTYPQVEKSVKLATIEFRHILQDSFLIVMGGLSASFGLIGFLLPNAFIDGGVTGISLILSEVTGISLALFIIVINVPFIILRLSTIGRQFALKSIIHPASCTFCAFYLLSGGNPGQTFDRSFWRVFFRAWNRTGCSGWGGDRRY